MTEAEAAALDLVADMRQTLVAMHSSTIEKNSEISSLKEQLAYFQTTDATAAATVAQERDWFENFRAAVFPAPAPVDQPAEEVAG